MKKMTCVLLAAVVLLCCISGCTPGQSASTNPVTQDTSASVGTTNGPVEVVLPTAPENPGNSLIDYDPDREIYFFSDGNDFAIYEGHTSIPGYSMYIMSKNELDVSAIHLSVPVQSAYVTNVRQIELLGTDRIQVHYHGNPGVFPYELYQCYLGKDFAKLLELEKTYYQYYQAYQKEECTFEELQAAKKAYEDYKYAEMDAYQQLNREDLPEFYLYFVYAMFPDGFQSGELFNQVELTIGEQVYSLDVGEVRLCSDIAFPAELDWNRGDYTFATHGVFGSGWAPQPYNDGIHRVDQYFSFTATEYMELKNVVLDNPSQSLEKVWIRLLTAGGIDVYQEWDMSEPFEIYEGDQIQIDIAYRQQALTALSYHTKLWGFLVYDYGDGTACKISECDINTGINYYEMYAIIFDGLDLESYYRDYYYPVNEPWRQEMGG